MRWFKLVGVNVALCIAMVAIALACVEGYLRATIPASSGGGLFESTLKTPRYKVMKPEAHIVAWGSDFRTNDLGFRDDDAHIPAKRAGSFRIVVLGDSFTASAGVDYPKIYTSLLQQALASTADVEVINLAVGGYNILQYEMVMDEVAMGLQPDLILTAVFPFNDLSNEDYKANYDDAKGIVRPSRKPSWYEELYVYRAYLGRIEGRIRRMLQPSLADGALATPAIHKDDDVSSAAAQNLAALERIMRKSRERGVEAAVALLPNTDAFEAQRGYFAPFVAFCGDPQWTCFNLLDRFAASHVEPASLRLNVLDPHPNDRYNAIAAGYLDEFLRPIIERHARAPRSPAQAATPAS